MTGPWSLTSKGHSWDSKVEFKVLPTTFYPASYTPSTRPVDPILTSPGELPARQEMSG